jgi:hypothetical protein
MAALSGTLEPGSSQEEKLLFFVEKIDTVILAADANNKIMILHSLKNFGGTRSRPDNKVLFMLGLGVHVTYLFIDLKTALTDCQIVVAAVTDIYDCKTAQDVAEFQLPKKIVSLVSKAPQFSSQPLSSTTQYWHQDQEKSAF